MLPGLIASWPEDRDSTSHAMIWCSKIDGNTDRWILKHIEEFHDILPWDGVFGRGYHLSSFFEAGSLDFLRTFAVV